MVQCAVRAFACHSVRPACAHAPSPLPRIVPQGLGKTVQVAVFLSALAASGMFRPSLIVCPATVLRQVWGVHGGARRAACMQVGGGLRV